ncbi:MAG: chromosome segregation protein SMC [Pseudomonadota bacterium]
MQIKRLKLSGFKSFVEPAELRVERGLTGIVGPNGCGKSNLLEAIRWVMGEGSAKSLRGGAMDDVIFAGTTQRPSRDFAEVSILLDGDAASDRGETEVVRRIERGAGSAYRINGRDVRAKDVALLFADAATGAHSPALVSQGRISAVISAKPAERRAMLEEAAGISGLHVRRKDAEQKLRATETNLGRLDEVLTDMEQRAGNLRRQAKAAERYRKLTGEIKIAEGRLIFARWRDAAAAADKAKAEAALAETKVSEAAEAQRAAAAWQAQAVTKLAALRSAAEAARTAAGAVGHRLATLGSESAALDRRIAELASQRVRLESDRAREGELASDAAAALARLLSESKALDARIVEAEAQRPAFAGRIAQAEAAVRDAEVALAQALAAQAREQAEARVADAALAAAVARAERTGRDKARLDQEMAGLGSDAPLIDVRDAAVAKRTRAEVDAVEARAAIDTAETARTATVATRDKAQSMGASAQAALSALEGEARALLKALEATGGKARALDQLRVAPGYERALAAALGDDLEAEIGTGVARGWAGADSVASDPPLPEGAAPLSHHVSAPDALARRIAQIAVVDRDEGQPLAVGQRIVTRDGQMRRWDGFIADGDGAAAAERLERVNRLATIEVVLPSAKADVATALEALGTAERVIGEARVAAESARRRLEANEVAIRTAQRDEDQAITALERLTSRRAEFVERLARAQAELVEAEGDVTAAKVARAALPDGVSTGQRVAQLQSASEATRASAAQIKAEAGALDRTITADRERLSAAQAESKGWKSRAGEAAARITEMDKRAAAAEAEALTLVDAPAKLAASIASAEAENAALIIATSEAAAAERAAEEELRGHQAVLDTIVEGLAAAREERAGAVARAENQELRRIEMGRISGERFECPPPLLPERVGFNASEVGQADSESPRLERLTLDRERIGPVNLLAEEELAEIESEREKSAAERDELAEAITRLRGSIGSLNREGRTRLLAAFEAVNGHFQRLFSTLFDGGAAHLALIDSDDPLEAGLEIFAQPPGKRLAALTLLSGGEQALTAVALIFGLFLTNPAPICVLDEVDAPLDDANIERFCDLLDAMSRETATRYLIVTHNAVTMSRMHRLFGVTMIEQGISRLVSVDLGGAEALLAAE